MTTRNPTILDPKFATDAVGAAASLGVLDTAPTATRTVAHTPEFHAPLPATPVLQPDLHEATPPSAGFDDFKAHPGTDDHHGGGVIPLPDPVFLAPGLFPIDGTAGDDDLDGTDVGDIINGLGGDDLISGGDGHDTIDGGGDDDEIYGDAGNDFIEGGDGDDALLGDGDQPPALNGNDFISGGAGEDVLSGMGGDDWLLGGDGEDILFGGEGADTLIGGPGGADIMYGNEGADAFLSMDDVQQHSIIDYSAAQGDTVEGTSWTFDAGANATTVYDGGAALFVLASYNAGVSGINLVQYDPAPAV